LAFTTQPTTTQANQTMAAVRVTARDASGNTVTSFTGTIIVALGANPGGGTLAGTKSVAAVNGVATFSTLSINNPGSGYTLVATGSGLSTTSAAFNITAPPPPPNSPPVVNAGADQQVLLGVLYTLNASFSDPDNGPWTYTIDWGDGSTSSGNRSIAGSFSVTHTYLGLSILGTRTIRVTITDSRGASGSDTKNVTIVIG
jgi:PKD domain-containing protein